MQLEYDGALGRAQRGTGRPNPICQRLAAEKVGQVAVRKTEGVMVEVSVGEINTPAIISTTAAGVIISLNRAAERLLGIAAEQVIGKADSRSVS